MLNDEMAFGAREAIVEEGLKVPDDVSLIGFDNWDMSGYSSMKLTTVERSMSEIAKEGTRVLLRRIEDGVEDNRQDRSGKPSDRPEYGQTAGVAGIQFFIYENYI